MAEPSEAAARLAGEAWWAGAAENELPRTYHDRRLLMNEQLLSRGIVTLVFDDGYDQVYKNVIPLLDRHQIPAVFAVAIDHHNIEHTERRPVKPWQQWLALRNQGHEIAAHSVSHTNLTKITKQQLDFELREPAAKLSAGTLVYPGGAYNQTTISAAQKYYQVARTTNWGLEDIRPQQPMQLKTCNFTRSNFSPLKANLLALQAWLTNKWLIETYHMVDNNETELTHTVSTDDLAKHLQFLRRIPIKISTIKDVIAEST